MSEFIHIQIRLAFVTSEEKIQKKHGLEEDEEETLKKTKICSLEGRRKLSGRKKIEEKHKLMI